MAKASKEEQIQKLKEWCRKNAVRMFMVSLAVLLAGRLYFFWQESNYVIPDNEKPRPQAMTVIDSKLDEKKPEISNMINNVVRLINQMPEFTTSTYYTLTQFNMFDPKTVSSADVLIARSNQYVAQAQSAFMAKQITQARHLLDEAMKINPSQAIGIKLRGEIDAYVAAQDKATTATAAKTK